MKNTRRNDWGDYLSDLLNPAKPLPDWWYFGLDTTDVQAVRAARGMTPVRPAKVDLSPIVWLPEERIDGLTEAQADRMVLAWHEATRFNEAKTAARRCG